uniref:Uncharacterized protein n=1 Tax=Picea glauca TaxID=3330 RepID=A0A101LYE7_PICGL|nr:hypothetical protein ABT39_MTgene5821 [Picea glauca]QHR92304.1 hypothetical protein Q903MT_gene6346 [Picea sitchensis]
MQNQEQNRKWTHKNKNMDQRKKWMLLHQSRSDAGREVSCGNRAPCLEDMDGSGVLFPSLWGEPVAGVG